MQRPIDLTTCETHHRWFAKPPPAAPVSSTPALFTTIVGTPNLAPMSFTAAAMASASVTFSVIPSPAMPSAARAALMASAPLSDVAVPMTVAPAPPRALAMAAPMPRVAPVTTATLPSSGFPPAQRRHQQRASERRFMEMAFSCPVRHIILHPAPTPTPISTTLSSCCGRLGGVCDTVSTHHTQRTTQPCMALCCRSLFPPPLSHLSLILPSQPFPPQPIFHLKHHEGAPCAVRAAIRRTTREHPHGAHIPQTFPVVHVPHP